MSYDKEYYQKNKDKFRKWAAEYRRKHPEKCKARS